MSDALCGPSNALQSLQKHSSVDRTLQQDRLIERSLPSQGFRSSSGDSRAIDVEFEAFAEGRDPLVVPPSHFAQPLPYSSRFMQHSSDPSWASDFQKLHITPSPVPSIQRYQSLATRSPSTASWHEDFVRSTGESLASHQGHEPEQPLRTRFGHVGMFELPQQVGYGSFNTEQITRTTMAVPQNTVREATRDQMAFERAFAQFDDQDLQGVALNVDQAENPIQTGRAFEHLEGALRNHDLTQTVAALKAMEEAGSVNWLTESFDESAASLVDLQSLADEFAPPDVNMRIESLIRGINEQRMSRYPLSAVRELPIRRDNEQDSQSTEKQSIMPQHEADQRLDQKSEQWRTRESNEMAETAGKLLESVATNTSEKFKKSQFLSLMRQLRNYEVRVEGDKMVEVNQGSSTSAAIPQPSESTSDHHSQAMNNQTDSLQNFALHDMLIDRNILNHAAIDFDIPVFPGCSNDNEHALKITSPSMSLTEQTHKAASRIPIYEQDLDLGRSGMSGFTHGLRRNGLNPPHNDLTNTEPAREAGFRSP